MILDVLPTVEDALTDPTTGLVARAREIMVSRATKLARIGAKSQVRAQPGDVATIPWVLAGTRQGSARYNIATSPVAYDGDLGSATGDFQEQTHVLRTGFEMFDADPALRLATVAVYQAAAFMVLRRLREYCDAHGGAAAGHTIKNVLSVTFQVGTFAQATASSPFAAGFIATTTLIEWSAV